MYHLLLLYPTDFCQPTSGQKMVSSGCKNKQNNHNPLSFLPFLTSSPHF